MTEPKKPTKTTRRQPRRVPKTLKKFQAELVSGKVAPTKENLEEAVAKYENSPVSIFTAKSRHLRPNFQHLQGLLDSWITGIEKNEFEFVSDDSLDYWQRSVLACCRLYSSEAVSPKMMKLLEYNRKMLDMLKESMVEEMKAVLKIIEDHRKTHEL